MSVSRLSRGFALNLLRLMDGESVNASTFGSRKLLKQLEEDRVVSRIASGRNRAVYRCGHPDALRNYLRLHLGITDLAAYVELLERDGLDGEDSLQATTSTKMLRRKGMQGFFIKAFGVELRMGEQVLPALPDGVEYFISEFQPLEIPSEALVVGVENPECFQKAARLLPLFPDPPLVFVLRFYSNRLLDWLGAVQNPYLHFGDFDPAGIAIYANEYVPVLGRDRCRFFVPEHMDRLLEQYGDPELFDRQRHLWPPSSDFQQRGLIRLIEQISRHGKGLEQEFLLKGMETCFQKSD